MSGADALDQRSGLPEALRVLADAFPREMWHGHQNFGEMVRFWMDRHGMFRQLIARIETDAQSLLDGNTDPNRYKAQLSRFGGLLLNELHMHHQVEDTHYFPRLITLDTRISSGFDLLEADHEAIDALLGRFATAANAVLGDAGNDITPHVGVFLSEATAFHGLLERHLTDEEDLVVPVILKTGFDG